LPQKSLMKSEKMFQIHSRKVEDATEFTESYGCRRQKNLPTAGLGRLDRLGSKS
jgi:hypothetical protein